jgi:hypothetical protein
LGHPRFYIWKYVADRVQERPITGIGIREAVLLDSGFSTSLVWKDEILVSGHSRPDMPSRPVPHALVIMPPAGAVAATSAPPSSESPS